MRRIAWMVLVGVCVSIAPATGRAADDADVKELLAGLKLYFPRLPVSERLTEGG